MLKLFRWAMISIILLSISALCHLVTLGFALVNIYPNSHDIEMTDESKVLADEILKQPFYLKDKGGQSYVFFSEDDRYVLKFIRCQRLRIPPWIELLPLPTPLAEIRRVKMDRQRERLNKLLTSFKNAYVDLKEESLVLDVNISQKKGRYQSKLIIYDKNHIRYELDPNTVPFVIQGKAEVFGPVLVKKLKAGDELFVKEALINCIDLMVNRVNKGYIDTDCYLRKNVGIIGTHPMLLDVGSFEKVSSFSKEDKVNHINWIMKPAFEMIKDSDTLSKAVQEYWISVQSTL